MGGNGEENNMQGQPHFVKGKICLYGVGKEAKRNCPDRKKALRIYHANITEERRNFKYTQAKDFGR